MRIIARPAFKTKESNPYNWLLYDAIEQLGVEVEEYSAKKLLQNRYDIFHIHWAESSFLCVSAFRAVYLAIALLIVTTIARFWGTKIVWTVHNLRSHDQRHPRLERLFWRWFIPKVDGYISLSHTAEAAVQATYPALLGRTSVVIPHGHYQSVYPNGVDRQSARSYLQIPLGRTVISFIGKVRPYKNIPDLIQAFRQWDQPNAILLIAGQPDSEATQQSIQSLIQDDPRILFHSKNIAPDKLQYYLNASDLVVLPYANILNSGTALLSLSFHCPVLVPNQGSLQELQEMVGSSWVKTYAGKLTSRDLEQALSKPDRHLDLAPFEWNAIAKSTIHFYQHLLVCNTNPVQPDLQKRVQFKVPLPGERDLG